MVDKIIENISNLDINGGLKQSDLLKEVTHNKKQSGDILIKPINLFLEVLSKDIIESIGKELDFNDKHTNIWIDLESILNNKLDLESEFLIKGEKKDKLLKDIHKALVLFLYYKNEENTELNFFNYIFKILKIKKKVFTRKRRVGEYMEIGKGEKLEIDSKQLFLSQEKLIKYIGIICKFISDFKSFIGEDIKGIQEFKVNKKTKISELNDILVYFSNLYINNNLNKDFANYLKKIINILYVFIKSFSYILQIKDSNIFERKDDDDDFLNILSKLDLDEENPSIVEMGGILALFTYGIEEIKGLGLNKLEKDYLGGNYPVSFLNKFKKSKAKKEVDKVESLEKRKIFLEIISKKPDLFLKGNKIPFNNLFNYITGDIDINKLEDILNFFSKNNNNFSEEELLFIIKNDLEEYVFLQNSNFLQKIIFWEEKNISINNIKKLRQEDFEVLIFIKDIKEVGFLIDFFLENKNNYKDYLEFIQVIESLKNDLFYLHKIADGYIELKDLSKAEFKYNTDINDFISNITEVYIEYNLKNIVSRNKELLGGENKNIEELNDFYKLFINLNQNNLKKLLEQIYGLNKQDFSYIKLILDKFRGNKNDYKKILDGGYIEAILEHRDLIDLYLEEGDNVLLSEILADIDEEEIIKNQDSTKEESQKINLYNELNKIYSIELSNKIKEKFTKKEDLIYIIGIGELLNSYKETFIFWILDKEKITTYNLKNLFTVLDFFYFREIKSFNRIRKVFEIAFNLSDNSKKLSFIEDEFIDINEIQNPEEFKSVILKYLKNGDKEIVSKYKKSFKNIKLDIISSNELDNYLVKIVLRGSDIEKANLGKQLENIILILVDNLSTRFLSSKINNRSGKGTGSSTNLFKQYYLRDLLRNQDENYEKYLERIYKINWRNLIHGKLSEDKGRKAVKNIYDSSEDKEYFFFEALDNLTTIIENFEKLKGGIDISNLLDTFNSLLNNLKKNFKRESNL